MTTINKKIQVVGGEDRERFIFNHLIFLLETNIGRPIGMLFIKDHDVNQDGNFYPHNCSLNLLNTNYVVYGNFLLMDLSSTHFKIYVRGHIIHWFYNAKQDPSHFIRKPCSRLFMSNSLGNQMLMSNQPPRWLHWSNRMWCGLPVNNRLLWSSWQTKLIARL